MLFEISFAVSRSLGVITVVKVGIDNGFFCRYGAIFGGDLLIKGDVAFTRNPVQVVMLRAPESFDISKHLELPYPQQEVQLNNNLNQKPEWE